MPDGTLLPFGERRKVRRPVGDTATSKESAADRVLAIAAREIAARLEPVPPQHQDAVLEAFAMLAAKIAAQQGALLTRLHGLRAQRRADRTGEA